MKTTMAMLSIAQPATATHLVIAIHNKDQADSESWAQWMELIRGLATEYNGELSKVSTLVVSDGGTPGSAQRALASEVIAGARSPPSTAIISDSTAIRLMVRALAIFDYKMRVFSPGEFREALISCNVSKSDQAAVFGQIERVTQETFGPEGLRTVNAVRASMGK